MVCLYKILSGLDVYIICMGLYKLAIIQLALLTIPECTGFGQAKPSICQAGPSPGLLCSLSPD